MNHRTHIEKSTSKKYIKNPRLQFLKDELLEETTTQSIKAQILALSEVVSPFTVSSLRINKKPVPDPTLSRISGKPMSRKFLYQAACYHFGSWNKALKACNLKQVKTSHNKFWNKTKILESIKALKAANHPLNVRSIWRDRKRSTTNVLIKTTGKATTGSGLHDAARRYFGSWDIALEKAKVNVENVKEKPFWTKKKIIKAIKAIEREGISLNAGNIGRDCSYKTSKIFKAEFGKKRMGRSLYYGAYQIFGSWDRALIEAKISPVKVRKCNFVWKKKSIARILNILWEYEIPINVASIQNDRSMETNSIIFNYTGQIATGSKLFRLGLKNIGSWDSTLKFSGFKLSEVRRSGSPCERNKEKIITMIRSFYRKSFALNWKAITDHSHKMMYFIEDNFGSAISGRSLYSAAVETFGSWDEALWEAGLNPVEIRLRSRPYTTHLPVVSTQAEDTYHNDKRRISTFLGAAPQTPEEILHESETNSKLWSAVESFSHDEQKIIHKIFDSILNTHHYKNQEQLIQFILEDLNSKTEQSFTESDVKQIFNNLANKMN